jgi:hypothetical protein
MMVPMRCAGRMRSGFIGCGEEVQARLDRCDVPEPARCAEALVVAAVDAGCTLRPRFGSDRLALRPGAWCGLPRRKLGEDVGIDFTTTNLLNEGWRDIKGASDEGAGIGSGEDVADLFRCEGAGAARWDGISAGCASGPAVRAARAAQAAVAEAGGSDDGDHHDGPAVAEGAGHRRVGLRSAAERLGSSSW